jgi:peptidoglycan/xylan/chitin deacetylase (PgdA/CDA1 family)/alkylation response protein AidB-like acyl-CoA dehydrogenase
VSPTLSLTFDDGPDVRWTGSMLDVLRRSGTRATFFMVGERVRAAPASARAVVEAGHDVQLHCDRHLRHSELSEEEIDRDVRDGLAALAGIGVRPSYWRTPWGVCTDATARVAARLGLSLIDWTIDTHDWRGDSAAEMLEHARPGVGEGGIVLMHDALGPGALRAGCENTVELVKELIVLARSQGLEVGALPSLEDARAASKRGRGARANAPDRRPVHDPQATAFARALGQIAARARELDMSPGFPSENFETLRAAGIPQLAAEPSSSDLAVESAIVRALAKADASSARILDGHFNGVERLALLAPRELRARELELIARGELLLGVWGADPGPGEGAPARLVQAADGRLVLSGVKTFCSGAGGVQRALVIARDEQGARRLAYADVSRHGVRLDRGWYRASGLRSSESHRVEFQDTPVLAVLGAEDEIMREPWFSRDAVRTAATWAGIADCILEQTVESLGQGNADELRLHALGRMRVAQASIDRWLEYTVARLADVRPAVKAGGDVDGTSADDGGGGDGQTDDGGDARALAGECRVALADAARLIAAEAARVCGSRALVGGGTLDRARRDLDLFLLQHRLDPKLVELGARTLRAGTP